MRCLDVSANNLTLEIRSMTAGALQPSAPIRPQTGRWPLFHGWMNLLVAALAMTATLPGRTYGLGLITEQLTTDPELKISDTLFGDLNFWAILLGSALCLPVGWCIDRFGARGVLVFVSIGLGLAVLCMSAAAGVLALLISLTLVRGLGQGALSVVSMALVGKWFTRRLPVAMGVFAVLLTVGMMVTVGVVAQAAQEFGWRQTWVGVGLFLIGVMAPLGALCHRGKPKLSGLADVPSEAAPARPDQPLGLALRSPAFWAFTLAMCLFNMAFSAITLFNEKLLRGRGLDRETFVLVMICLVAVGLPTNLISGWLATRWPMGRLLALGMLLLAVALALFPHVRTETAALWFGTALGVSGGIITVIWFSVYGQAYGKLHLGSIQAVGQALCVVASALGPAVLMRSYNLFDSFFPYFYASGGLAVLLAVTVWMVRLPQRNTLERSF